MGRHVANTREDYRQRLLTAIAFLDSLMADVASNTDYYRELKDLREIMRGKR